MINQDYNYQFRVAGNKQLATLINLLPFKFDDVSFDYRFTISLSGDHLSLMFKLLDQKEIKIGYVLDCLAYASRVRMSRLYVDYETTLPLDIDKYYANYVQK